MTIAAVVVGLEMQGVELWLDAGRLRYRAPQGLGERVRAELGGRRAEVVELLEQRARAAASGARRLSAESAAARPSAEVVWGGQGAHLRSLFGGCAEGAAEVARVEADALALGWTLGELWSVTGWYHERGLVASLRPGCRVVQVRADRMVLEVPGAPGRVRQSFGRHPRATFVAESGWWRNRPATCVNQSSEPARPDQMGLTP